MFIQKIIGYFKNMFNSFQIEKFPDKVTEDEYFKN